jgi:hypothetical protein
MSVPAGGSFDDSCMVHGGYYSTGPPYLILESQLKVVLGCLEPIWVAVFSENVLMKRPSQSGIGRFSSSMLPNELL